MRIYSFTVLENHEWILPVDAGAYETFFSMSGALGSQWHPPVMKILKKDDLGKGRVHSDFPWLGEHAPILRPKAVNALQNTLETHGELLPLACPESVQLFNATRIVDALDQAGSEIVRFDNGDILNIERYRFDPAAIGALELFRLPMRCSPVFVTQEFVSRTADANLEGVAFRLLWSDEGDEAGESISFPGRSISRKPWGWWRPVSMRRIW